MQQQTVVVVDSSDFIAASKVTWNLTNRGGYTRHPDKSVGSICGPTATDAEACAQCSLTHQCDIAAG